MDGALGEYAANLPVSGSYRQTPVIALRADTDPTIVDSGVEAGHVSTRFVQPVVSWTVCVAVEVFDSAV